MHPKSVLPILVLLLFSILGKTTSIQNPLYNWQVNPSSFTTQIEIIEPIERKISIKLESVLQVSNNHVGTDWSHFLSVQKQVIKKGETLILTLEKRAPMSIEAHSIETDKYYNDYGKSSMDLIYSDLIAIDKNRFEMDVTVVENGGQYAGNTAKWKFLFMIKRVK